MLVSLFATGNCFLSGEKGFGEGKKEKNEKKKKQLAGRCSVSLHCHGVTACCRDVKLLSLCPITDFHGVRVSCIDVNYCHGFCLLY